MSRDACVASCWIGDSRVPISARDRHKAELFPWPSRHV